MKLTELPVFFLDLQTTGSKPGQSHILEWAWGTNDSTEVDSFLLQLPEDHLVPRPIQELTGIGAQEMLEAQPEDEVFKKFLGFLAAMENRPAIIHYASFEKAFLEFAFAQRNLEISFSILCTHQIAKRLHPNLPTRGIKGLAGYYGYLKSEVKRSADHVEASRIIWSGLITDLAEKGIENYDQLQSWIIESPAKKRNKYEYPLAKEKRLSLPSQPGIYRMLNKKSEVLYVGKATSLKDRVNSYFRGQKGRDAKKLEMLTQVWDLDVTPCETPLEAALLETDEIKRLDPRYNVSLKAGDRQIVFYSKDFTSISWTQDEDHPIGPFSSPWVLDSVIKLAKSLKENDGQKLDGHIFYEPDDSDKIYSGFKIFCEDHNLDPRYFTSVRSILAVGLNWSRFDQQEEVGAQDIPEPTEEENLEELELTAEDYADRFKRHFIKAGRAYWRAKTLTKLLNSRIEFENPNNGQFRELVFVEGQISDSDLTSSTKSLKWAHLGVDTYDRMSVLYSELLKIPRDKRSIHRTLVRDHLQP